MRLWHKDLIQVLPDQQLKGQWSECCKIAKLIQTKETPNHLLVNKVMEYPLEHLYTYGMIVYGEMKTRGYNPKISSFQRWIPGRHQSPVYKQELFRYWHDKRYIKQCLYNLQEKADCGGIDLHEWQKVVFIFGEYFV